MLMSYVSLHKGNSITGGRSICQMALGIVRIGCREISSNIVCGRDIGCGSIALSLSLAAAAARKNIILESRKTFQIQQRYNIVASDEIIDGYH